MKGEDEPLKESLGLNEIISESVVKYSRCIIMVAFTYVKNISDAQDIAQDTFLTYMIKNPTFENKEHEKAWLIRVAINKSKNYLKSPWKKRTTTLKEDLCYMQKEEIYLLEQVLQLDEKYKIPIHLYYYEGYSIEEISKIIGKKTGTIGTLLSRGRKILKIELGGVIDD